MLAESGPDSLIRRIDPQLLPSARSEACEACTVERKPNIAWLNCSGASRLSRFGATARCTTLAEPSRTRHLLDLLRNPAVHEMQDFVHVLIHQSVV